MLRKAEIKRARECKKRIAANYQIVIYKKLVQTKMPAQQILKIAIKVPILSVVSTDRTIDIIFSALSVSKNY